MAEPLICPVADNIARSPLRSQAEGAVPDQSAPTTAAGEAPEPEETLMWSQLAELADRVLRSLPDDERRVLILREIEGHTFAEIAETEEICAATARARHARGMERLQRAQDEGRLDALVEPLTRAESDGPRSEPPTLEMRERAWQRFVASGALDPPPDSDPPPSGRRPKRQPSRLSKLGLVLLFFVAEPPEAQARALAVTPASAAAATWGVLSA